jgi:hypothetical protein
VLAAVCKIDHETYQQPDDQPPPILRRKREHQQQAREDRSGQGTVAPERTIRIGMRPTMTSTAATITNESPDVRHSASRLSGRNPAIDATKTGENR